MNVDEGRTRRAFAALAAFFAVLGAVGLLGPASSNAEEGSWQGAAFAQSFDMVGSVLSGELPEGDEIPAWFADELFYIEGAQSFSSEDVGVYGFVSDDSLSALEADVRCQMQERGWALVGSADPADSDDAAGSADSDGAADLSCSADAGSSEGLSSSAYLSFSRSGGEPSSVVLGFTEQDLGTTVVVQVMG